MLIIGIAGGTGSGKTTVVSQIIEQLKNGEVDVLPIVPTMSRLKLFKPLLKMDCPKFVSLGKMKSQFGQLLKKKIKAEGQDYWQVKLKLKLNEAKRAPPQKMV